MGVQKTMDFSNQLIQLNYLILQHKMDENLYNMIVVN